jgi:putative membrane protein
MALFLLILLLEIRPMVTFIRWRAQLGRGLQVDTSSAPRLYTLNHVELALVVVMVFVAGMMARGVGF